MDFLTSPTFWIKLIQFLLSISFLVLIHEAGHCIVAKLNRVRVEQFYMFFNPVFSIIRMKKFDNKWHFQFFHRNEEQDDWLTKEPDNTIWGIGWLPLGGYCAIAGMVDETHDANQLGAEPQPWEFRTKNVWQRLSIIIAGITVNFIAALIIFSVIFYTWGETRLPLNNVTQGLYYSKVFTSQGLQQRDKILMVDSMVPETTGDLLEWIVIEGKRHLVIQRADSVFPITLSESTGQDFLAASSAFDKVEREHVRNDHTYRKLPYVGMAEYYPMVIAQTMEGFPAELALMHPGDSIVSIAGIVTGCVYEVQHELRKHPMDSITIGFYRAGEPLETRAFIGDQCYLGIAMEPISSFYALETTHYSFWQSIPKGIQYGWNKLVEYVKQFRLVFTKEGAQNLGGFVAIGNLFPARWSWYSFWYMTAFLSLILAFMNFLPIPALDGGYILFLLVELVMGRKPSDKFLEVANNIGFWLLIALLIFANGNDLLRIFF